MLILEDKVYNFSLVNLKKGITYEINDSYPTP